MDADNNNNNNKGFFKSVNKTVYVLCNLISLQKCKLYKFNL